MSSLLAARFGDSSPLRLSRVSDAWLVFAVFAVAGVLGGLLVHYRHSHMPYHPRLTLADMRVHVASGDALILDSREHGAFLAGHLPGAVNLPVNEWSRRSQRLDAILRAHRDRLVIVYCTNIWCGQAEELQQVLIEDGHRRVGLFPEGFDSWRDGGGEVVSP